MQHDNALFSTAWTMMTNDQKCLLDAFQTADLELPMYSRTREIVHAYYCKMNHLLIDHDGAMPTGSLMLYP